MSDFQGVPLTEVSALFNSHHWDTGVQQWDQTAASCDGYGSRGAVSDLAALVFGLMLPAAVHTGRHSSCQPAFWLCTCCAGPQLKRLLPAPQIKRTLFLHGMAAVLATRLVYSTLV